jgi:co-chaperonin GroES (HSP10)
MPLDYEIDGYLCAADATIDQIHPRKDILLVRRIPDEEVLASGLVVPAMARDSKTGVRIGEVLKCGPGDEITRYPDGPDGPTYYRCNAEMECKPGDRVAYMRCPDNDVNIGGVDCVLLREEQHVLAIL